MTIAEYKELCKKDVLKIGQDVKEIKLGTNVKSKIHDDLLVQLYYLIDQMIMLL